jgi:hypothetical protein
MDEIIFLKTLKRIRWITDRDDLTEAVTSTLKLLLRRPGDKQLLSNLLGQVKVITGQLPTGGTASRRTPAVRQAALRCIVLLQSAKHGRLTRGESEELRNRRQRGRLKVLLVASLATCALYLLWLLPDRKLTSSGSEIADQMADALHSSPLGVSQRGDVKVRATREHITVSVDRLSPEDCVTAAEKIQPKITSLATLFINDIEVGRSTHDKLIRLCGATKDASLTITRMELHNH